MFEGAGFAVYDLPVLRRRPPAACASTRCSPRSQPCRRSSIVLLHACCHNPTGVDLAPAQWQAADPGAAAHARLIPYRRHRLPGLRRRPGRRRLRRARCCAAATTARRSLLLRQFVLEELLRSTANAAAALSVVCPNPAEAELVLGQLKATVRSNYSSPPMHGGQIVARVLRRRRRCAPQWAGELDAMRTPHPRHAPVAARRAQRASCPAAISTTSCSQRGMFSYTGLSAAQVDRLREEHSRSIWCARAGCASPA